MNFKQCFMISVIMTASSFTAFSGTVAASVVYSGYDVGSTSLAGSPNATTAAAAFDLATGTLSTIDFEFGLPVGVMSASGGLIGDASVVCATPDLHCYATSPINVYRNNGATFEFESPINSFGAYFTGWQLDGQTITIGYSNGGEAVLDMPAGNFAGGTLFFGFIDVGTSITSITYFAGTPSSDAVGIDDVRYGNVVPIPAAVWFFGSGLLSLIGISKFKRAAKPLKHL